MNETVANFLEEKTLNGHRVRMYGTTEVCQGGPVIGELCIDGQSVSRRVYFGGPFIEWDNYIYLTIYKGGRFQLARVALDSLSIERCGVPVGLCWVGHICDNVLHYYLDLDKKKVASVSCDEFKSANIRERRACIFSWIFGRMSD